MWTTFMQSLSYLNLIDVCVTVGREFAGNIMNNIIHFMIIVTKQWDTLDDNGGFIHTGHNFYNWKLSYTAISDQCFRTFNKHRFESSTTFFMAVKQI